jgi:hypothetical protein
MEDGPPDETVGDVGATAADLELRHIQYGAYLFALGKRIPRKQTGLRFLIPQKSRHSDACVPATDSD